MSSEGKRAASPGQTGSSPATKKVAGRPDPKITDTVSVGKTRWVNLSTVTYIDRNLAERKWDVVSRTTKKAEAYADAVVIISVVNGGRFSEPHIILVKQWRPPMAKYTIEMPAGLIDAGETPAQAAIRELKEECGLVGTAESVSPELNLSPGISNETAAIVHCKIDMNCEENSNPVQELDDGEDIEILYVPVKGLVATLKEFDGKGYSNFMGLYGLAVGLEMSLTF